MNQINRQATYTILLTLCAIAFIWISPVGMDIAVAQTSLVPAPSLQEEPAEILTAKETNLPPKVKSAVLKNAARQTNQTMATLRILKAQPQNWSDGCLGLAKPDELCTQVITPGWRVVVTNGQRNWTYRTDNTGNLVKLEKASQ
ncbi:MAG: hypothetical protein ACRC80_11665 [Waterburya sp.]